jgi:hypothetical protein
MKTQIYFIKTDDSLLIIRETSFTRALMLANSRNQVIKRNKQVAYMEDITVLSDEIGIIEDMNYEITI